MSTNHSQYVREPYLQPGHNDLGLKAQREWRTAAELGSIEYDKRIRALLAKIK